MHAWVVLDPDPDLYLSHGHDRRLYYDLLAPPLLPLLPFALPHYPPVSTHELAHFVHLSLKAASDEPGRPPWPR
ncbi:hypothetical protein FRC12_024239 [Ceratobasidium sp. 428]|nr:hypothetical protein FRC12_024239 [Ceratobasidium sp. 428]